MAPTVIENGTEIKGESNKAKSVEYHDITQLEFVIHAGLEGLKTQVGVYPQAEVSDTETVRLASGSSRMYV